MQAETVIQTKDLTKIYDNQIAVDHLSLSIGRGEIFGFLGPNGAGKTTTLLMLLGLTEPTGGTVRVMELSPTRSPIEVKMVVGYLPENLGFYRDMNAGQMLQFVADLNRIPRVMARERIDEALTEVGLIEERGKMIGSYSRGMRQRLGIAELLIKSPQIALLDEPTLGLDPDATNKMIELIRKLSEKKHMSVVLSSHLLHQAQKICNRIGIMIKGRMVADGPMDRLAAENFEIGQSEYTLEEIYMRYFRGE